jgi:hypothetical protein
MRLPERGKGSPPKAGPVPRRPLPGAELEAAQLALETARHELTQQRELLDGLRQVRVQDVDVAPKRLDVARTKMDSARVGLNRDNRRLPVRYSRFMLIPARM